jgi:hypothetical protein
MTYHTGRHTKPRRETKRTEDGTAGRRNGPNHGNASPFIIGIYRYRLGIDSRENHDQISYCRRAPPVPISMRLEISLRPRSAENSPSPSSYCSSHRRPLSRHRQFTPPAFLSPPSAICVVSLHGRQVRRQHQRSRRSPGCERRTPRLLRACGIAGSHRATSTGLIFVALHPI